MNKKVNISQKYISEVRRHLFFCKKYGPENHIEYLKLNEGFSPKSAYKDWLLGKICFVNSIRPDLAKPLFDKFNNIDWLI